MALVLALLALLAQAGDATFSGAEVSGEESTSATMEVDVEVTVQGSEGPVVAHLLLPGESEQVKPLVRRTGSRWGAVLEVRRADWRIVFEDVASGAVSEESSLTELGLDPALLGLLPPGDGSQRPEEGRSRALAASLATLAGLVALFGVWVLFGGARPSGRHRP